MTDLEKRKEIVAQLKPIDDAFATKLLEDSLVCQEVLATILNEPNLTVEEVTAQNTIKNLQGRSVQLDALCKRTDGTFFYVEIQKKDDDDHIKRTRYNATCITANITDPGTRYENVPEVYIIFISRFDLFKAGKTTYHMENILLENNQLVDNGQHIIFVNTKINDGSKTAELMQCFEQPYVDNPDFPHLSYRVQQFKNNEEVQENMCESIENYAREYAKEYAKATRKADAAEYAKKGFVMNLLFEQVRTLVNSELLTDDELLAIEREVKGVVA